MKHNVQKLYKQYGFVIYGRCEQILHNQEDAWDATQEVFMKLITHYDTIKDKQKVVSWIYSAATNYCFNQLRRQKKWSSHVDVEQISRESRIEQRLSAKQLIDHALQFHSPKVHQAVYFTYIEQLEQKEIQKITGQSPATIRRNLQKFKASLRALSNRAD